MALLQVHKDIGHALDRPRVEGTGNPLNSQIGSPHGQ